jgi:hypothetical protein
LFHPLVIKSEYYFGTRIWPLFLLAGAGCSIASVLVGNLLVSILLGIKGFSFFWSILELFQQKRRVEKGWFPRNPKKKCRY